MFSKKNLEADLYYLMRKYTSACLSTFFFFHPVLYWQLHEIIYACKGGLYGCTFSLTHLSCGVFLCSELDAQMDGCLQQRLFTSGIPLRVFCTYILTATTLLSSFLIKKPDWLHRTLKQISTYGSVLSSMPCLASGLPI